MSKLIKNLFKGLAFLLLLLLIAAIAIPYFYKPEVLNYLKEDLSKNLNADVDFSDVNLSLLKSFPNLHFSINDLSVKGKEDFEDITLIDADLIGFSLDLMSVIKKEENIKVHSVELKNPIINVFVDRYGKANYNILKGDSTTSKSSEQELYFVLDLDSYQIENGDISYIDQYNRLQITSKGVNHEGNGTFSQSTFDLDTKTNIESFDLSSGGIQYLFHDRLDMDLIIGVNTSDKSYIIKENEIFINALQLLCQGEIHQQNEDYSLDINIKAPGNQFKELLSVLPGAYTADFNKVNSSGRFELVAQLKGLFNSSKPIYPNIDLKLKVNDGQFQYPEMPGGLKDLVADLLVKGNLGNLDNLEIIADKFNFEINQESFESNFVLKNILSNPALKGKLKGLIDLNFIGENFPMEGVQKLSGFFDTDIVFDVNYNQLEKGPFDEIVLNGHAEIRDMMYDAEGLPALNISKANLNFSPSSVDLTSFEGAYGNSDFSGKGKLDNFLAIILPAKTLSGTFDLKSRLLDIDELLGFEEATSSQAVNQSSSSSEEVFDRFAIDLSASVDNLKYDVYPIRDFRFEGNIQPNNIDIISTKGFLGSSDFSAKGNFSDVFKYLYSNGELKGNLDIGSRSLDLNEYMAFGSDQHAGAKTINDEENFEAVILPERTNIDINAQIQNLTYTDLKFSNTKGKITIKDQEAVLKNCQLFGLGGKMLLDGKYKSSNIEKPHFDLNYEMQKVDFGQVFSKFVSWEKIAPLGKYLKGDFNTKLNFAGDLTDGNYPDLNSITADGLLQTINATLTAFPPIEKIANTLKIKEFQNLQIIDTKNRFEIKDGKLIVEEFDYKYKGIDMLIGGSHSLTQDMDYSIKAKIPKSLIQSNKVGQLANQGLSFLEQQASKAGFNLDQGEFLNVLLNIGGSIKAPTLKVKILGTDGSSTIVEQVVDSVKETVKEKVDSVKTVVTNKVDEGKKELKAKMDAEINNVMKLAEKQAQNIRNAGKKAASEAKKVGYQNADKLVKEAGNNIFKKKAAELAATQMKKETDKRALQIEAEADKKAKAVMDKAEIQAQKIRAKYAAL